MWRTPGGGRRAERRAAGLRDPDIFSATATGGGGSSTSPRKPDRWRARSSSERQAGTTSTKRNSAALSSASCAASSIALSSAAFSGWREERGRSSASCAAHRVQLALEARGVHHAAESTALPRLELVRELGLLSVVAPLHDEADTVAAFHARTLAALEGLEVELVLVDDGSRDGTRGAPGRPGGRRRAGEGRDAVAQLRPPGGAQRRARPRARGRRGDARRRPPGSAGGASPRCSTPGAAAPTSSTPCASRARGRRASSCSPRAGSTACSRRLARIDLDGGLGRLPADGPRAARRAARHARARRASCAA